MRKRTELKARLRAIEIILHWAWDPIGIRGMEGAADEYDSYALPVLGLLERAAPEQEVADYLTSIEVDRMGLKANKASADRNFDIAVMMRELHAVICTTQNGN